MGGLKVRRVKARDNMHYGSTRVEFDSVKIGRRIVAQSLLEFIEYMRLEADPDVLTYRDHPGTIMIQDENDKVLRSVFDAEVHTSYGETIYEEIKYEKELKKGTDDEKDPFRSLRQVKIQEEWCRQNGYTYKLVTDRDLLVDNPALFNNCLYIVQRLRPERAGDMQVVKATAASIYKRLRESGKWTVISSLATNMDDALEMEGIMTAICYLLQEGYIETDIEHQPLFIGSEVKVNG